MSRPEHKGDARYTYADYRSWPEDERWELIHGVAYAMSPAPTHSHQSIVLEIGGQANEQLRGRKCRAFIAPFDVRFEASRADQSDTVVQPDVGVYCDPDKTDERGGIGAPDWIVEVLSKSTAGKDQVTKRALYESRGVREYWTVHPVDRVVHVYRLENGAYQESGVHELTGQLAVDAVEGLIIDWDLWEPPPSSDD